MRFSYFGAGLSIMFVLSLLIHWGTIGLADVTLESLSPLLEQAQESGSVRVIVELDVPLRPMGKMTSSSIAAQKANIARVQDDLLKHLAPGDSMDVDRIIHTPFIALEVTQQGLQRLATFPKTLNIQADTLVKPGQVNRNPILIPELSDSVPQIGGDGSGTFNGKTGNGWAVAIIDTGVDKSHTFFNSGTKVISEACYSSNTGISTSVCPGAVEVSTASGSGVNCSLSIDGCDHGTHVAGIAAGDGVSFSGVAKNADIIAIQVFSRFNASDDCSPSPAPCALAWTSDIIKGLDRVFALRNTFSIASVNMSIGGGSSAVACDGDSMKPSADNLVSANIAVIAASGNDGSSSTIDSPGCISSIISVGSVTKSDIVSSFSNAAPILDLLAPGSSIESSVPGNNFAFFFGTSMATPHVAGAFAVMREQDDTSAVSVLLAALKNTGTSILDSRNGTTYPRIQVDSALTQLTPSSPVIVSFKANDPDTSNDGYSVGDTLTIGFDVDTNQPGGAGIQNKTAVDNLFNFSQNLGANYQGQWTTADEFTITILDITGATVSVGVATTTPTGSAGFEIRDDGDLSDPSSDTSPILSGDFNSASVIWISLTNTEATDNNLGKNAGGNGWNADARSQQEIASGDGYIEMTVASGETETNRILGLSNTDPNAGRDSIRFGLYLLDGGRLFIRELGTNVFTSGTYTGGDILRVEISSGSVIYKKNGLTFHISSLSSIYPMFIDTSLHTLGSTFENVRLSATPAGPPAAPVITSFVADDPDNGDTAYGNGDTLAIGFDVDTNQPGGAGTQNKAAVDNLFTFSQSLGTDYTGQWSDAQTFVVTIVDASGEGGVAVSTTTTTPAGTTDILDSTAQSSESTATSPALSGDFGQTGPAEEDVIWISLTNTQSSGNDLTKSSGGGGWNADARSQQEIASGDGYVEMSVASGETETNRILGLTNTDPDANRNSIRFGLYLADGGRIFIRELGSNVFTTGTYTGGDVLRVEISGGSVLYKKNGSTVHTSALSPVYPMFVDTSLNTVGASFEDVKIATTPAGPPAAPVITSFVADDPDDGDVIYSVGDTLTITFDKATNQPAGTPTQLFNFSSSLGTVNGSWTAADTYTITVTNTSGATVAIDSTTATPSGSPAILDSTAQSSASSTTSPALSGDFGQIGPAEQNVVWTSLTNTQSSGNDLTKNSGGNGWNADARSQQELTSGDGYVEMSVASGETETNRILGLTNTDPDANRNSIRFGLYLADGGRLFIRELGSNVFTSGTYTGGDVLRVEISGGSVLYKRNGSTFHTSALSPVYPMFVDTSLHTVGASFEDVKVSGTISGGSGISSQPATQLKLSSNSQSFDADAGTAAIQMTVEFLGANGSPADVAAGTQVTLNSSLFSETLTSTGGSTISSNIIFTTPAAPEAVVVTATPSLTGVSIDTLTLFFNKPGINAMNIVENRFTGAGTLTLQPNTDGIHQITMTKTAGAIATVTTARFSGNPGGQASFESRGFFDIHLDNPATVTQLVIEFCPATNPPGVFFWDGSAWRSVSSQVAASNCISVTVSATTFPNLNDLSGQFFGVGGNITGGDPPIWENLMVFPTPENALGIDLNHDGDTLDTVLRYENLETGEITNTGLAVSGKHRDVDIYEDSIVFVEESQYSSGHIGVYDINTGEVQRTGAIGYRPTIFGDKVAISGDTVRYYDLTENRLVNTGIPGESLAIYGNIIAYHRTAHRGFHPTLRYYNLETNTLVNTKVAGILPAIYEDVIAFTTLEPWINQDLNGDGDISDSIIRYYNMTTDTLHETGQVGYYPAIHGERIVYTSQREVRYYQMNTDEVFHTGVYGTEPDIYDDTISYYLWEKWAVEDLNGDGDQRDPIVSTYKIPALDQARQLEDTQIEQVAIEPLKVDSVFAHPNPVTVSDQMTFTVQGSGIEAIQVEVFDLSGHQVYQSGFVPGSSLIWRPVNQDGTLLANGVYLYLVSVRGGIDRQIYDKAKKMVILR